MSKSLLVFTAPYYFNSTFRRIDLPRNSHHKCLLKYKILPFLYGQMIIFNIFLFRFSKSWFLLHFYLELVALEVTMQCTKVRARVEPFRLFGYDGFKLTRKVLC